MSTAVLHHVIRNDAEHAEYTAALFNLTGKANPTRDEEEEIELLTLLVESYETKRYPMPDVEPADMLRFLIEQNGLAQRDLAEELGSESTVSSILSGRRSLTRDHITKLSKRFHVSPAVFFPRAS